MGWIWVEIMSQWRLSNWRLLDLRSDRIRVSERGSALLGLRFYSGNYISVCYKRIDLRLKIFDIGNSIRVKKSK